MHLIDAHCHLQDERLDAVRSDCIDQYRSSGTDRVMVNGTHPRDWEAVAELARLSDLVTPSFGVHPWFVDDLPSDWDRSLSRYLDEFEDAGVGEVGLDRWVEGYDIDLQIKVFRTQLRLCQNFERPLTIHCLKAWGHLTNVLEGEWTDRKPFLLHSYSGSSELAQRYIGMGAYFSVSGYFAHERKAKAREVFASIPADRILVETDAPDMLGPDSTISHAHKAHGEPVNHPLNLEKIYRFATTIWGLELEEFAQTVSDNWNRFTLR